jgi:hypothetical protein
VSGRVMDASGNYDLKVEFLENDNSIGMPVSKTLDHAGGISRFF